MPFYPQPRDRIPFHKDFCHEPLAPPPRSTKSKPNRFPRTPELTAPRHKWDVQLKQDPVNGRKALDEITRGEQRRVVDPFGVGRGGKEVWEAECMVYCLDPVLRDDKRRLLDIAGDMLHYDDAKFVHGTRVSAIHARNFALPMWHENDKPGNKADPECHMRMPVAYFREVKARREERRMEIEMRVEVKRAKEARKAEMSRIEEEKRRSEKAKHSKKERIEEERAKVRKMYNDMGGEEDIRKRSAERRRIIGEQLRLGKNVVLIKAYLEELTDKYIEEIKSGLRTDLPI
ncbi:hypothetical protein VP1G_11412 [Cytospora mali]|uniref:Uncharacterized protein n=1 Tax=Cytospora mali TaxID=578113 RepID=A0A194VFT1_CYTMA|nr:hypothetical protein VP1G_11412 [Valsa mali var. pyri (nom. inval.)]